MPRSTVFGAHLALVGAIVSFVPCADSFAEVAFTDQTAAIFGAATLPAYTSHSASLADIDGDGDLDLLFVTSGAPTLYRNNLIGGTMTYTDVTAMMLPSTGISNGWSSAWGDYNGDGKVDLYLGQTNTGTGSIASGDL